MALSVQNKEGYIDRSISKPDLNDPLYVPWRKCNHVVSTRTRAEQNPTQIAQLDQPKLNRSIWVGILSSIGFEKLNLRLG